jgi:small subunit ribosomal protein S8
MDPIADMLTTIRNAILVKRYSCNVTYSNVKWHILKLMEELKLIDGLTKDEKTRLISFTLVQEKDGSVRMKELNRISSPGRRTYVGWKGIPRPTGNGLVIVSTSQGVMTGKLARQRHLGGELICEIF